MNKCRIYRGSWTALICGVLVLSFLPRSAVATEETFPTLQVGSHVYTNVTVTTKAKNYIFIHHSTGMENIRLADLPEEIRSELGYIPELSKKEKAAAWAKGKMADLHLGEVNPEELRDPKKWQEQSAIVLEKARSLDHKMCGAILGGLLLIYFFFCYCCAQICQKAGAQSAVLVWFPVAKVVALLRAARMSTSWFFVYVFMLAAPSLGPIIPPDWFLGYLVLGCLISVLAIIGAIVWCFKIASARGKSPLVGFCLLLPVISFFAFLYLAFSDAPKPPPVKEDRRTEHLMTLETA
jgi:hypothetical protein